MDIGSAFGITLHFSSLLWMEKSSMRISPLLPEIRQASILAVKVLINAPGFLKLQYFVG
jgi:hypothetical protein